VNGHQKARLRSRRRQQAGRLPLAAGAHPGNKEFCINLEVAKTGKQKTLVGRQAAGLPLFSIETSDCMSEYRALKDRGVEFEGEPQVHPYGTGVLMKDMRQQDLPQPGLT
jgi:hypothetical protein